jgi:hypothetical protein
MLVEKPAWDGGPDFPVMVAVSIMGQAALRDFHLKPRKSP